MKKVKLGKVFSELMKTRYSQKTIKSKKQYCRKIKHKKGDLCRY